MNSNTLQQYLLDRVNHRVKTMLRYRITSNGGGILFEWWFTDQGQQINRIISIDLPNNLDVQTLISTLDKIDILDELTATAILYGGMKAFLELQPNFMYLKKLLST